MTGGGAANKRDAAVKISQLAGRPGGTQGAKAASVRIND